MKKEKRSNVRYKMQNIIQFEKVSKVQFEKDARKYGFIINMDTYQEIQLPKRATKGSAGYDFYMPAKCIIKPGQTITIPTGIRCQMNDDIVLQIYPRSSLGFKYQLQLDNTVGIIDSDYYHSDNEGHIIIKMTNHSLEQKELTLNKGDAFSQGLFLKYYLTVDDDTKTTRNGGFGSTNQK